MLGQGHTTKRRQKRDVSQSAEEQPCLGGGRGLGCWLQKKLRWERGPGRRAGLVFGAPGWGWDSGGEGAAQEPRFQLSFPAPGIGGELPITTDAGVRPGCPPSGEMPCKERTLMLGLRA